MKAASFIGSMLLLLGLAGCSDQGEGYYGQDQDARISAATQQELTEEGLPRSIRVAASNGVVTLNGTVRDADMKERAQEIAEDIDGVDRVQNNLRTTMAGDAPEQRRPAGINDGTLQRDPGTQPGQPGTQPGTLPGGQPGTQPDGQPGTATDTLR